MKFSFEAIAEKIVAELIPATKVAIAHGEPKLAILNRIDGSYGKLYDAGRVDYQAHCMRSALVRDEFRRAYISAGRELDAEREKAIAIVEEAFA